MCTPIPAARWSTRLPTASTGPKALRYIQHRRYRSIRGNEKQGDIDRGNFPKTIASLSVVLLAVSAGCAGSSVPAAAPVVVNSSASHALAGLAGLNVPSTGVIYVSSSSANTVYVYPKKLAKGANPAPIGTITDGVFGAIG